MEKDMEKNKEKSVEKNMDKRMEKGMEKNMEKNKEKNKEKSVEKSNEKSIEKSNEKSIEKSLEMNMEINKEENKELNMEKNMEKQNTLRNKNGLIEKEFLAAYDPGRYERPSVTVDMLIFTIMNEEKSNYRKLPDKALKILMIKRGDHPYLGQWALPGGFVNMDESMEAAARRELMEETNIDNIYMEQLFTWGDVGRDPRTRVISTSYLSLIDSSTLEIKAADDADDAGWFTVSCKLFQEQKIVKSNGYELQRIYQLHLSSEEDNLSAVIKVEKNVVGKVTKIERTIVESQGIAFDHAKIIMYGLERLRNKIEYTDIAFNLMPEFFTLTELQQVYEIIMDTELLKANFRRKIADMVVETNEFTKDAGHRPSKLFRYNTDWSKSNV